MHCEQGVQEVVAQTASQLMVDLEAVEGPQVQMAFRAWV